MAVNCYQTTLGLTNKYFVTFHNITKKKLLNFESLRRLHILDLLLPLLVLDQCSTYRHVLIKYKTIIKSYLLIGL